MYKLLLVSDQADVLNAFGAIDNWEMMGFKTPHIRHDFEGARDSLEKHHADGIAIAVNPEEEAKIMDHLRLCFPNLSVFKAGREPDEVRRYLSELGMLLNRTHADFSNDCFGETDMLAMCRHEYFRKLMSGRVQTREQLLRNLLLLRSKMDPNKPCSVIEMTQAVESDKLSGRWHYGPERLELALRNVFGKEMNGCLIRPAVLPDDRIVMVVCPVIGDTDVTDHDERTKLILEHFDESMAHVSEYLGLDLKIAGIRRLPALTALCSE